MVFLLYSALVGRYVLGMKSPELALFAALEFIILRKQRHIVRATVQKVSNVFRFEKGLGDYHFFRTPEGWMSRRTEFLIHITEPCFGQEKIASSTTPLILTG